MTNIREELDAVFRDVSAAFARGLGAAAVAERLYVDPVVVVGEGNPAAARGLAQFLPQLADLIEGWGFSPTLTFTLVDPILAAESVATTFVAVEVAPPGVGAVVERYRVLYGWTRTSRGWRVALEMFDAGQF